MDQNEKVFDGTLIEDYVFVFQMLVVYLQSTYKASFFMYHLWEGCIIHVFFSFFLFSSHSSLQ